MSGNRVQSIDTLRGFVMVIMALDHVRDFFHNDALLHDPLDLQTTSPILYFTRWITHFCAPVFVFLSGTSAYLYGLNKTKKQLSLFLIKRGFWLVLIEVTIVTLGWTFNPFFSVFILQVIWAIGISMVILGLLVWLPFNLIFFIGLIIVAGHNLLDYPEAALRHNVNFWWNLIHNARFTFYPIDQNHGLIIAYPFLPWTGLMCMGYCMGKWFEPRVLPEKRHKKLLKTGFSVIVFFVLLRMVNAYGDPFHWSMQKNMVFTFLWFSRVL